MGILRCGELFGTVRSYSYRFGIIDAADGLSYVVRDDGVEPDNLGRRFLVPGEKVIFNPAQHFSNRIALKVQPQGRVEEFFTPDSNDWFDVVVDRVVPGFMFSYLKDTNIEVFISNRVVVRSSGSTKNLEVNPGDVLAVRIQPTTNPKARIKFEAVEAVIEDVPSPQATFKDLVEKKNV